MDEGEQDFRSSSQTLYQDFIYNTLSTHHHFYLYTSPNTINMKGDCGCNGSASACNCGSGCKCLSQHW